MFASKVMHNHPSISTTRSFSQFYIWGGCLIFSFLIQLIANYDSPLHTYFLKVDSSYFFMGGKAMINGYLPYTDFSDSKGPLVWLFYGLGYLISPRSYLGVYVLYSILFSFIFYLAYRTAVCIFSQQKKEVRSLMSFASAILFAIPLFCYNHREMRCEDLCQLPLLYCIYILVISIKKPHLHHAFKRGILIGISLAVIFMIKFNVMAYSLPIPLSIIAIIWKREQSFKTALKLIEGMLLGFLIICLPIFMVFYLCDGLYAFLFEYFVHTSLTMSKTLEQFLIRYFIIDIPSSFQFSRLIGFIALWGPLIVLHKYKRAKYLPILCALFIFFACTYNGGAAIHYHSTYVSWFIFACCAIVWGIFRLCHYKRILSVSMATILTIAFISAYSLVYHKNWIWLDNSREYLETERKLSHLHNPTIVNWSYIEYNVGLSANSLPGCRYWAMQSNSPLTEPEQRATVLKRIPDIVTILEGDTFGEAVLDSLNYAHLSTVDDVFHRKYSIYVKSELLPIIQQP